jgi:hypothetical protein
VFLLSFWMMNSAWADVWSGDSKSSSHGERQGPHLFNDVISQCPLYPCLFEASLTSEVCNSSDAVGAAPLNPSAVQLYLLEAFQWALKGMPRNLGFLDVISMHISSLSNAQAKILYVLEFHVLIPFFVQWCLDTKQAGQHDRSLYQETNKSCC